MDLEYKTIEDNIGPFLLAEIINKIQSSKEFEIADESVTGRLNHIVIKNTNVIVGYIGADNSYKLVNPDNNELKPFHNSLLRIYNKVVFDSLDKIL